DRFVHFALPNDDRRAPGEFLADETVLRDAQVISAWRQIPECESPERIRARDERLSRSAGEFDARGIERRLRGGISENDRSIETPASGCRLKHEEHRNEKTHCDAPSVSSRRISVRQEESGGGT